MNLRCLLPLLVPSLIGSSAQAYVLIDDFTAGGFTHVLTQEHSFSIMESGLDTGHVAFGSRQNTVRIDGNPNHTELQIHVGDGEQALRSPMPIAWSHDLGYGDLQFEVDFSAETEFWVDLTAQGALADDWSMKVMDSNGMTASNGGWLHRNEGIRFRKQAFTRQVDWSRIVFINFTQDWDDFPNPLEYRVTRFYAVPEPSIAFAGLLLLGVVRMRRQEAKRCP